MDAQASAGITVTGERKRPTHEWLRAQSQHFVIISNRRRVDVERLLQRLEDFNYTLRVFTGLAPEDSEKAPKTRLYFLGDERDLSQVAPGQVPDYAIGLYSACTEGVQAFGVDMQYMTAPKAPLEKQPENSGLSYIFQAYAREFWYRHSLQRAPLWFVEGFAYYFSSARFAEDQAIVGMAPEAQGAAAMRTGRFSLNYADVLLGTDRDVVRVNGEPQIKAEFGWRAWVLTHWILSSPANRERFSQYNAAVLAGEAQVAAFKRIYQLSPSRLDDLLWRYAAKLQALKLTYKAPPQADVSVAMLGPKGEGPGLLADAALQACPAPRTAQKLLASVQEMAQASPASPAVQMALARVQVVAGNPRDALPWLEAHAGKPGADTASDEPREAAYLLARAHLGLALAASDDAARAAELQAARKGFLASLALSPTHAPSAYGFYWAGVLAGLTDDDTLGAAIVAYRLAPEVDAYGYNAALAYAFAGQAEQSRKVMRALASEPVDSVWSAAAKAWLKRGPTSVGAPDLAAAVGLAGSAPAVAVQRGTPGSGGRLQWTMASAAVLAALDSAASVESAMEAGVLGQ